MFASDSLASSTISVEASTFCRVRCWRCIEGSPPGSIEEDGSSSTSDGDSATVKSTVRRDNRDTDCGMVQRVAGPTASYGLFTLCLVVILGTVSSGCRSITCDDAEAFGNLGPHVNSPYNEYSPWLSDSTNLLFTSDRITPGGAGLREILAAERPASLHRTLRLTEEWDPALRFGIYDADEGNPLASIFPYAVTDPDGMVACGVLCGQEPGANRGGCDLFFVAEGADQRRVRPAEGVNTASWEGHPHLTSDGARLYFASDRPGGRGKSDIWYLERNRAGLWGPPINAGNSVNTAGDEISPAVDPTTGDLYFAASASEGDDFDIMVHEEGSVMRRALAPPFNSLATEITPFVLDNHLFLASDREGGCGGLDLYRFPLRR
mgnify:CR=1 FL=1